MPKTRKSAKPGLFPVVILAGGLGTRLGSLTEQRPKALVPIAGKPFLFHQLDLLRKKGIDRVVLSVGHLAEKIATALQEFQRGTLRIELVEDGPTLLGTGGAVRKAAERIKSPFFVLYGDSYLDIDYAAVQAAYEKSSKDGLMVVYKNRNALQQSNVIFRGGLVIRYDKEHGSPEMEYIDYGLSILRPQTLAGFAAETNFDLGAAYQKLIGSKQLAGWETKRRFYEVGSVAGIEALEKHLAEK